MAKMVERNIGRCLTEYKLENYDTLVKSFARYFRVSQFDSAPNWVRDDDPRIVLEPKCGNGEVLYGVTSSGNLHKLMSIIDSSD